MCGMGGIACRLKAHVATTHHRTAGTLSHGSFGTVRETASPQPHHDRNSREY